MERSLKKELHAYCLQYARERLQNIREATATARESANDESKSSAGDKHETGRAMAQLEQEKLSQQLSETHKLLKILSSIDPTESSERIKMGSLIDTDNGSYYLAISAGKMIIDDRVFFLISAASPIGSALIGSNGHSFIFNGKKYLIKNIS